MSVEKREFDWTLAKERLQKTGASLRESITISPERTAEILERRARALAQSQQKEDSIQRLRVLTFRVGAEWYAIETTHVRGVMRLSELTPLPDAPPHVVGITILRGEILPLFDLRQLLGRGSQALTDLSRVVIVGGDQLELGLIADEASEIIDLPLQNILAPSASITGANREIVHGITEQAMTVLAAAPLCRDSRFFITTGSN